MCRFGYVRSLRFPRSHPVPIWFLQVSGRIAGLHRRGLAGSWCGRYRLHLRRSHLPPGVGPESHHQRFPDARLCQGYGDSHRPGHRLPGVPPPRAKGGDQALRDPRGSPDPPDGSGVVCGDHRLRFPGVEGIHGFLGRCRCEPISGLDAIQAG